MTICYSRLALSLVPAPDVPPNRVRGVAGILFRMASQQTATKPQVTPSDLMKSSLSSKAHFPLSILFLEEVGGGSDAFV